MKLLPGRRPGWLIAALVAGSLGCASAASAAPALLTTWGGPGKTAGLLGVDPFGVAAGLGGNVYVADPANHRVQGFTARGAFLFAATGAGDGAGRLGAPRGVAAAGDGTVFVTDADHDRVIVLTAAGDFVRVWGAGGSAPGRLASPAGVAIAPGGLVVVADEGNSRVQEFTAAGDFVRSFGSPAEGPGKLVDPQGVAVTPAGDILVTDHAAGLIRRFGSTGAPLGSWNATGGPGGPLKAPTGIAADRHGDVYVADGANDRVLRLGSTGAWIEEWGGSGATPGRFASPAGIALDCRHGVYVVDAGNQRVQKFGRTAPDPPCALPVAAFSATPAPAATGQPVRLDAGASRDPDGTVVRYEWDLDGDGRFETDAGAAPVLDHAFASAGSIAVALRITDDDGDHAEVSHPVTIVTPGSAVLGTTAQSGLRPLLGVTALAERVKGKVRVRVLGRASVALTGPVLVPIGSEIDTTAGRVRLTFATALADGGPPTQSGEFYDGAFTIFQSTKATLVELGLSGAASGCGKTASSSATTNRKRKRKVLWGDAHGQFRSTGANAAATVRGTRWLTENNCDGTRVQVARGVVSVRDLVRNTTTEVRAGHSYTARNPCASRRRFDIRVRVPPGVLVRDVRVSVRGKKVKVRRGKRIVATIDLRNAPRGRFTVHITLVTTSGAEIDGSRVYRTCSQELDPGAPPTI